MPAAVPRREHAGAAASATLTASMSPADVSFSISTNTGWPTGGVGSFGVVLDPATSSEEKVLCSTQSGSVVSVTTRGWDGTTAKSHAIGAVAYPVWSAVEADELNEHANATTGVHGLGSGVALAGTAVGEIHVVASATSGTAINAAQTALPAGGGTIVLDAGTHTINTAVLINKNIEIRGLARFGSTLVFDGGVVTTAIKMADTTQRRVTLRNFRIDTTTGSAGTGTAIDASYFVESTFDNLVIGGSSTSSPNIGVDYSTGGTTFYDMISNCRISTSGTAPVCIRYDNGSNSHVVSNCRLLCVNTVSTGTGVAVLGANTYDILLSHLDIESNDMIGIDLAAGAADITIIQPYLETLVIGLRIAANAEAIRVLGGRITNCSTANVQDNGGRSVTIDNLRLDNDPWSSLDRLAVAKSKVNGIRTPMNDWSPDDFGLVAWAGDPAIFASATATVNGTLYLARLNLRYAETITNLSLGISVVAVTPTTNQNFVGLYNSAGTLVGSSAAGTWDTKITAAGYAVGALSTPYAAAAGKYWVGVVFNAATPPQLARGHGTAAGFPVLGAAGADRRWATNGTSLTALPASFTPGANALSGLTFWAGAS